LRPTFAKRFGLSSELEAALELVTQSTRSLLCAVVGSVIMGVVFDKVQFWPAFVKIEELFILVPVLLNLKGCLEMNLASRLSTSVLFPRGPF
jgi:solute carrier family 41